MKKTIYALLALGIIAGSLEAATLARAEHYTASAAPIEALSRSQRAWLGALEWCESRGQEKIVNPKDLDGTPSYGLLQFKPSTFEYYARLYGYYNAPADTHLLLESTMDPDIQEQIVEQMILRGGINWQHQFPDCVRRLGLPPAAIHTGR